MTSMQLPPMNDMTTYNPPPAPPSYPQPQPPPQAAYVAVPPVAIFQAATTTIPQVILQAPPSPMIPLATAVAAPPQNYWTGQYPSQAQGWGGKRRGGRGKGTTGEEHGLGTC